MICFFIIFLEIAKTMKTRLLINHIIKNVVFRFLRCEIKSDDDYPPQPPPQKVSKNRSKKDGKLGLVEQCAKCPWS